MALEIHESTRDEDLVRYARGGDTAAFGALVMRHHDTVFAIGMARLRSREQAEDLAQEVFLRALLLLDRLDDDAKFLPWVCRIARNLSTDWQRGRQRSERLVPMIPWNEVTLEPADGARNVREKMQESEETLALKKALEELPQSERELVFLHYMEDRSYREIAAMTGTSLSGVARGLKRALSRMHGILESSLQRELPGQRPDRSSAKRAAQLSIAVAGLSFTSRGLLVASAAKGIESALGAGIPLAAKFKAFIAGLTAAKVAVLAGAIVLSTGGAVLMSGEKKPTAVQAAPRRVSIPPTIRQVVVANDGFVYIQTSADPVYLPADHPQNNFLRERTETGFHELTDDRGRTYALVTSDEGNGTVTMLFAPPYYGENALPPTRLTFTVSFNTHMSNQPRIPVASSDVHTWEKMDRIFSAGSMVEIILAADAFVRNSQFDLAEKYLRTIPGEPRGLDDALSREFIRLRIAYLKNDWEDVIKRYEKWESIVRPSLYETDSRWNHGFQMYLAALAATKQKNKLVMQLRAAERDLTSKRRKVFDNSFARLAIDLSPHMTNAEMSEVLGTDLRTDERLREFPQFRNWVATN